MFANLDAFRKDLADSFFQPLPRFQFICLFVFLLLPVSEQ